MDLESFIKEYSPLVRIIFYSFHSRLLDDDDLSEVQYEGLWKAWESYRGNKVGKCSIKSWITAIIRNRIISILRKKKKIRSRECELSHDCVYNIPPDISENFTQDEWKFITPLLEGETISDTAKMFKMDHNKYTKIRDIVLNRRKDKKT